MENISQLTNLAFRFGPFLFALLFTLYVSRWGYKNYNKANLRTNPRATKNEINTLRLYFLGTASFGLILVIVSIIWWINYQVEFHVFQGKIVNLKEYEKIVSNDLYFKTILIPNSEEGLPQIRDEHFIFIQDEPFKEDQNFKIYYSKGEGKREGFSINYNPQLRAEYCIDFDENSGTEVLKCLTSLKETFHFLNSAYAQEDLNYVTDEKSSSANDRIDNYLIDLLQEERTDIGQKIDILDELIRLDDSRLKYYLETITYKESMILTLLDLSRHTDKELAYKAKKIINERFKVDDYLVNELVSNSQSEDKIIQVLYRVEKDRALNILNRIPSNLKDLKIRNIIREIESGEKTSVLYPSGSAKGDRYYVKAKWDYNDSDVVECLTNLFYKELIHNRTYDEEVNLMKGKDNRRSERWVYWYSKEWALSIAKKIEKCGGKASFVPIRY